MVIANAPNDFNQLQLNVNPNIVPNMPTCLHRRSTALKCLATLSLLIGLAGHLSAATYYVDYSGGSNQADGLSPQTAWKHSPGDKKATDKPKAAALAAGDTILFKGGVTYFGEIEITASGSEGNPIKLDGNSGGTFGEGRAILDGARIITNWKPVESQEAVLGNPLWKDIYYADLDVDTSSNFNQSGYVLHRDKNTNSQAPWQRVFLIDGERKVLPIAQRPKPSDPFFPDMPGDFYNSATPLVNDYPHKIYFEEGTRGNATTPLISITYGGKNAPVVQPLNGGKISVDMAGPANITEIGFTLFRPASTASPEHIVFFADDKEVLKVAVDATDAEMQRFALPAPVDAKKLTFQLLTSDPKAPVWTKFQQIAAFTADGTNVIQHKISTAVQDKERIVQEDPTWYDEMFIGVHGGNNHVYFAKVQRYEPATNRLFTPHFEAKIYEQAKYAFFNSPKLIDLPGEWSLQALDNGKTRAFLLPENLENDAPTNVGYPVLKDPIVLDRGASHIEIRGFLIQRYAGGQGGVFTKGRGESRTTNLLVADCEIRFISAEAGVNLNFVENAVVEDCTIHHCPGWTVGIYVNRSSNFRLSRNRLDTNSGSGIRHYEAKHGVINENVILKHFGMHSSGLNFYEGCYDILFENNFVHNTVAINRNAEKLVFKNNVLDGLGKTSVSVAMWTSGRAGGRAIKDIHFLNNTFVNTDESLDWATGIFGQKAGSPSPPEGLIIQNNILDGLALDISGIIENNIYTRKVEDRFMGKDCVVITDTASLFINPAEGDFRRKPGGQMMEVGANIPPPSVIRKPAP